MESAESEPGHSQDGDAPHEDAAIRMASGEPESGRSCDDRQSRLPKDTGIGGR